MDKDFYKKLERILQLLDSRFSHFTDSDMDGQTLTVEDDIEVYDKIDLLLNSSPSESVKEELRYVQKKIREAFLLSKDLMERLKMWD